MTKRIFEQPLAHCLLILLAGALVYANTLGVPFIFDDEASILRNPVVHDLGSFAFGGDGYRSNPPRWFGYLTFALNYRFGGLNVAGYHVVNLLIHLGAALLVYRLAALTFRTPLLAASRLAPRAGTVALLAALLFTVHPVQTQAVTYIVQRLTSLCTLFYLLALVLYIQGRLCCKESAAAPPPPPARKKAAPAPQPAAAGTAPNWQALLPLAGAVLAAALAMRTKEIAFTLPFAALLFEAAFFTGPWKRRLLFLLPLLLTLPLVPLAVLGASDGGAVELGRQLRADSTLSRPDYLFTQFRVIVTYLRLLVLPIDQNVDYDYPVYTTLFTPPVLLSLLLLLALLALGAWLWKKSVPDASAPGARPELRVIAFAIGWFFLTLSVESSLIPIGDVIFEHRLYLPLAGLAPALAVLVLLAGEATPGLLAGRLPLCAAAAILLCLAGAAWQRNRLWQDKLALWEDVVRKSPGKSRPWYNLGSYMGDAGQPAEAIRMLSKAVELNPKHAEAWQNLGRAYLINNQPREAISALEASLKLDPEMSNSLINIAVARLQLGQPGEAVALLEPLRQKLPNQPEVRLDLAIAYLGLGRKAEALGELEVLKRLNPQQAAQLEREIQRSEAGRGN